MKNTSLALLTGLAFSLSACGGSSPTIPSTEVTPIAKPVPVTAPVVIVPARPTGSPDYYVLGISGKCLTTQGGIVLLDNCGDLSKADIHAQSTVNNYNYLVLRGTIPGIADTIAKKGYRAVYAGYAASLPDRKNLSSGSEQTSSGFMTMERQIIDIYNNSIKGVSNPAKIVLIGHSHGVVWSHLFTMLHPEVPIEIQIDFDGVCLYWVSDNQGDFATYGYNTNIDFSKICNGPAALFGGSRNDLQNRVFDNVKYNVEIQSFDPALRDSVVNIRENGETSTVFSSKFLELHSGVTQTSSDGFHFAVQEVDVLTIRK